MKIPHTPGPWLRSKSFNTFQIVAGEDMNGDPNTLLATVHPIGYNCRYEPCEETKANARLIASAPELLDALNAAYNALAWPDDEMTDEEEEELLESIRAALRKAKGEE